MRQRAPYLLAALIGVSFVVRTGLAWLRATPALFPDEYIYSSIGRSLAESGRPLIRGGPAHFPALLQPILTAPAWMFGDVDTAFRTVQAIGAFAMSLAAVPVYVLAVRLGLSRRIALALAAFAVLIPDLLYTSFITSEPFAYPLVLAAVAAGVVALAEPTRRAQLAFVGFAGLATLTRAQLVVVPVVFVVAVFVVGAFEHRVRPTLREQLLPLAVMAVPVLGLVATGPTHVLGYYKPVLHMQIDPTGFARWVGWDAMVLTYTAGWIVIPGALLGLWLSLRSPTTRIELAFGVVVCLLALALLTEAGLLQANTGPEVSALTPGEIKERYVFYLAPLAAISFALYAKRGWPLRIPHLALAAALVLLSVRVPLSGFAVASTLSASPVLFAVYWLTNQLGGAGNASGVVAGTAALLSVVAVLASRRPRVGTPVVLGLALLACSAASAGAVALDVQSTSNLRRSALPRDPSWVDSLHLGRPVTLVESYSGVRTLSLQELFWNRSIARVALLPGAARFDAFRVVAVRVQADGSLMLGDGPLEGPLLVDTYGSTVRLRGARIVATAPHSALWLPYGTAAPRLSLYAPGRYVDGWLASRGFITVWPERAGSPVSGWLTMRLTVPRGLGRVDMTFQPPHGDRISLHLPPGGSARVRLPVCSPQSARVTYHSARATFLGLRPVSAKATAPVFTPDPSACTPPRSSSRS
ncbi:MAG TPA: hypothetical protein VH760_04380 [Gaiellaceae bacterium]